MHHIEQKNRVNYRYEKTFTTKVFENNRYVGKNFKAFVRRNMKNNFSLGTFKKTYSKIKNRKYFYSKKIGNMEILIYPYNIFYFDFDNFLKKQKKIFIRAKA